VGYILLVVVEIWWCSGETAAEYGNGGSSGIEAGLHCVPSALTYGGWA